MSPLPEAPASRRPPPAPRLTPAPPPAPLPTAAAPALLRRVDQVRARIRLLRTSAGLARMAERLALAGALLYLLDRWLVLPVAVRAALLVLVAALALRELWRHVGRPLVLGPGRLDAARLVERALPRAQGRIVSALQLPAGGPGSLESRVHDEAAELARAEDLRQVLRARPALRVVGRAAGVLAALALAVALGRPYLDVFARRWSLEDVAWPRDTRLFLDLPAEGPHHRVAEDGSVVVARGGVIEVGARAEGRGPGRVELVIEGARGERTALMSSTPEGGWRGRLPIERDDLHLRVRGGDDDGSESRVRLTVVDPPRIDNTRYRIEPPAYLGMAAREVGPAELSLDEGTRVTLLGDVPPGVVSGTLRLLSAGLELPLRLAETDGARQAVAEFAADVSDTLVVELVGEAGLPTPDPDHVAMLVRKDRPPTLRVFSPPRSDLKVTARAVVAFAALAEDDHGVASVRLLAGGAESELLPDEGRPAHRRRLLDLAEQPIAGVLEYRIEAVDGRDLPNRGPQAASAEGRRIEVVEDAEVQRLLADRQLRLKEAFASVRERQRAAAEPVRELAASPPPADDPELLAAFVAQGQVGSRLTRETRELCTVLEELLLNRLDAAPGAAAVLARRLDDWRATPVDERFTPGPWRALAAEHAAGAFGRLDLVGRLLDMVGVALRLEQEDSPRAQALLAEARRRPDAAGLAAAHEAQLAVLAGLDTLLGRMEEWEDYQEVLLVLKTLIDEQRAVRDRTQSALSGSREAR